MTRSTLADVLQNTVMARRLSLTAAISGLLIAATLTFVAASLLHFGVSIPIAGTTIKDSSEGAAISEMIIAIVMASGSLSVVGRLRASWQIALATVLFALLGVLYGLSVTVRGARIGDIAYHVTVLVILLITGGLLLMPNARRTLGSAR